jgi:5'-nucleotidase
MHLLLTNDDGISAPGLLALKQALEGLGPITVIAPSRNYSAAGHRKTMHKPLRIDPARLDDGTPAWVCSGAPSDCVALALLGFVKEKVDLVVSGINPTPNLGQDLTYSGTVTAALESVIANVPGLAISTEGLEPSDYAQAGRVAAAVARAMARHGLPAGVALNVNVPAGTLKGLRFTRQGCSVFRDALVERLDPRGRPYYWIGGDRPTGLAEEGTDFWAMEQGFVSITPLQLDLTAHAALPALMEWKLDDL